MKPGQVKIRYYKIFLHQKCHRALEQSAQGSGWVTILRVFERCVDVALGEFSQELAVLG